MLLKISGETTSERMKDRAKANPVVDVTGDRSKIQCCKEQYCIGVFYLSIFFKFFTVNII